jgi:hypothetical protein
VNASTARWMRSQSWWHLQGLRLTGVGRGVDAEAPVSIKKAKKAKKEVKDDEAEVEERRKRSEEAAPSDSEDEAPATKKKVLASSPLRLLCSRSGGALSPRGGRRDAVAQLILHLLHPQREFCQPLLHLQPPCSFRRCLHRCLHRCRRLRLLRPLP